MSDLTQWLELKALGFTDAGADRQMANLTVQYQSDIKAALAGNDYQKAAALVA